MYIYKKNQKIKTPLIADISGGEIGEKRRILALYKGRKGLGKKAKESCKNYY